ncbi:hypothetical protein CC2G_008490 [Coprinopsis cinerea AmutBmut pab1-1]|nr:hypothetical protein CC2G_008490 [Coprinopsis cinerea AmutBmut pab1-1]
MDWDPCGNQLGPQPELTFHGNAPQRHIAMLASPAALEQVHSFHKRSLTLPSAFRSSKAAVAEALKLSTIYPVYEEDTHSSVDRGSQLSGTRPPSTDITALALELEKVERLHQEDKVFYTQEIAHLRRLLADAEEVVREQRGVIRRQNLQLEETSRRMQVLIEERNRLREFNDKLLVDLEATRKDFAEAMEDLAATQKELAPAANNGSLRQRRSMEEEKRVERFDGLSDADEAGTGTLRKYLGIPVKVAALRQKLAEGEERFQAAYSAWSQSSRHQRRLSIAAATGVTKMNLKDRLTFTSKELEVARRELKSGRIHYPPQEREDITSMVHELNARIRDLTSELSVAVEQSPDGSLTKPDSSLARALLGDQLTAALPSLKPTLVSSQLSIHGIWI